MAHPVQDQRANTRALAVLAASGRRPLAGARGGGRSPWIGRPPFHRNAPARADRLARRQCRLFYRLYAQRPARGDHQRTGARDRRLAGKFLMLLHYLGRRHGNITVGVDIFTHSRQEPILRHAEALFGTAAGLSLHEINSADLTAEATLALLGHERPRAISVDGDHTAAGVLRDLRLSAAIVAERGVLILDDVLNPSAAGVAEGTYRFLLEPGCRFVPFAQIGNKTFVCRREAHDFYLQAGRNFSQDCADLEIVQRFMLRRSD
ncbi:MAG: class I SAM-dependent methyltransferase, partial [Microvirga sp.]